MNANLDICDINVSDSQIVSVSYGNGKINISVAGDINNLYIEFHFVIGMKMGYPEGEDLSHISIGHKGSFLDECCNFLDEECSLFKEYSFVSAWDSKKLLTVVASRVSSTNVVAI